MANSKAHGRSQLAFLLCLVSCSLASTLSTALAGRHLADSSDSSLLEVPRATQNGLSNSIEKSPRNPPSGPSAGTHPEDVGPALAVPVLSQLPRQAIALSLQPSQQVRLKQVEVWEPTGGVLPLSAEIKKGGIQPPSGPSPGGNGAQPLSRSAGIEKGGVQPPSGPSLGGNGAQPLSRSAGIIQPPSGPSPSGN